MEGKPMTAIEEFFRGMPELQDEVHNSEIIMNRMDEIEGVSLNPIDKFIRWSRRKAIQRFPFMDLAFDFVGLSILETFIFMFNTRIKPVVEGKENRFKHPRVIFACNHETEAEHLYLAQALSPHRDIPSPFGILKALNFTRFANKRDVPIFFAKYQLFNVPIVGSILMSTAFPIERELTDRKSMEIGSEFLRRGNNVLIYPEGTRNVKAQAKAKSGMIRLAIENQVPIVPVGHNGLFDITKGGFVPQKKGIWHCSIGEPIFYDQYYGQELPYETLRTLTEDLMNKIGELKENSSRYREIQEAKRFKPLSEQTINEMVVNKFEKLKKKPKDPIDTFYRRFVKFASKLGNVGEYVDSFTNAVIRLGVDVLVNNVTFNFKITGKEHVLNTRPAILCSNHESFLDIPIQGKYLVDSDRLNYYGYLYAKDDRPLSDKIWFMMKRELAEIPLLSSWTLSAAGFPVGRGESDKEAYEIAKELIKRGRKVVIYPQETTRGEIDVDKCKTGAVRMAIETGAPIIPISIKGSHHAMKKGLWKLLFPPKGYPIEMNVGPPIHYDEYAGKQLSYEEMKKLTRDLMQTIKDMHEGKKKYPSKNTSIDEERTIVDKSFALAGKPFGIPRRDLQEVEKSSPVEKVINRLTDQFGITKIDRDEKKKKFYKLNPVDSFLGKLRKRGEKLGLTQLLDKTFYNFAKDSFEFLLDNLYDFKVRGLENIPNDGSGIVFTTASTSKLDFFIINAIFEKKQVHCVVDNKTYQMPVVSTLLQSLGFLRQTAAAEDFESILQLKEVLLAKEYVAMFPQSKNPDILRRTFAGVVKLAKEGFPTYIIPVGISGTETPFPPVKIRVAFGKPFGPIKRMNRVKRYALADEIGAAVKAAKREAYELRYYYLKERVQ